MLAAIVYKLRAESSAMFVSDNGRYMHAVFLRLIEQVSPEISAYLHDEIERKPFSVSCLDKCCKTVKKMRRKIQPGEMFEWRVGIFNEDIFQAALAFRYGQIITVGELQLSLQEIIVDGEKHSRSGITDEADLLAVCMGIGNIKEISFSFISPTSFRIKQSDCPWPTPELIFGSLSAKWNSAGLLPSFDEAGIRDAAKQLLPLDWSGSTRRVRFSRDRWILCFTGKFTYDVSALDSECIGALLCLAQFAVFAGIGRMTAQGLGEVVVEYQ